MPDENDPASPEDTTATDPQVEEETAESPETETGEGSETSEDQGKAEEKPEESDEFEIVIDGEEAKAEEPPKDNAAWAAARIRERDKDARIAQLEREAQARSQPEATPDDPGPKPTAESCGWDEDERDRQLIVWHEKTKAHEANKAEAAKAVEASNRAWEDNRSSIVKAEQDLVKRSPKAKEAIGVFYNAFVGDKTGKVKAIAHLFGEKAPLIAAALGQDPARLKDLVEEKDLAFFIKKVSKLEDKVQEKRKGTTPPPPERKISGTGAASGAVDAQEQRLREQAMKTGDITALRAYKKSRAK